MKTIGIVTWLGVAVTAAAPVPRANDAAMFATPKATEAFAECFAQTQDRRGAPWWFAPRDQGGAFSNAGARGVANPYLLTIADRGARRDVRLEQGTSSSAIKEAVSQCL